jgi:imidazolonepropionase-like amidohydrolase
MGQADIGSFARRLTMKTMHAYALVLLSIIVHSCSSSEKISYNPETALLLQSAALFDSKSGEMTEPQDILIDGEKIIAIQPADSGIAAAQSIDCSGKYVIPGLCDSHTHLAFLTTSGDDSLRAELAEFVHRGVLYVRDVGGPIDVMSNMKERIAAGEIVGPEIFHTGPMFESSPLHWVEFNKTLPDFTVALDKKEDIDNLLPQLATKGASLLKTFNNISPDLYPYIVEIANKNHLKIVHDPGSPLLNWVPIHTALELGITSIEHAKAPWPYVLKDEYRTQHDALVGAHADPEEQAAFTRHMAELGLASVSEERLRDLSTRMIDKNAVLCPTLRIFKVWEEELQAAAAQAELTEDQKRREAILTGMKAVSEHFVRVLSANGVKLLVGQDNSRAAGTLEEMLLMKEAGVTNVEVLKGATTYAAEWLEVDHTYGAVEPGKIADLVILNSNPLDDIAHVSDISMVMQHGKIEMKR